MTLRTAKLPERGTATVWDGSLKHFGVRISKGGAKSFIVLLGSGRRRAIGRYPALSLAKAREMAKIILAQPALGKHQLGAISWKKAIDQYLDFVKRNQRPHTHHEYARTLKGYFPFGNTKNSGKVHLIAVISGIVLFRPDQMRPVCVLKHASRLKIFRFD